MKTCVMIIACSGVRGVVEIREADAQLGTHARVVDSIDDCKSPGRQAPSVRRLVANVAPYGLVDPVPDGYVSHVGPMRIQNALRDVVQQAYPRATWRHGVARGGGVVMDVPVAIAEQDGRTVALVAGTLAGG